MHVQEETSKMKPPEKRRLAKRLAELSSKLPSQQDGEGAVEGAAEGSGGRPVAGLGTT